MRGNIMVIVKLKGGLGNQLFQYAAARRIALDNNLDLKLDILSGFENDFYKQKYKLNHFNIIEDFATKEEIDHLKRLGSTNLIGKVTRLRNSFRFGHKYCLIRERMFNFDASILRHYKYAYLDGYWQSEKYFQSIEEVIRKEFSMKSPPEVLNQQIADKIIKTNSVCIHYRRLHGISGDKVCSRGVAIHGATSFEYYHSAINYLSSKYSDLHFFVFSDNSEWAQQNVQIDFPTIFVTYNRDEKDYEDLQLMSQCKYYIIANSSFSWWGAWLNQSEDKIVIAPKQWFRANINTVDLCPPEWILI